MTEAFAAYVNTGNILSAVDAGCGSGRMCRLLPSLGLDIFRD